MRVAALERTRPVIAGLVVGASLFVHSQSQLQVGYSVLAPDSGAAIPVGSALFTYTNSSGVLVSQAAVGAVAAIASGRIFVGQDDAQTGIAWANPSAQAASIQLILRDASGKESRRKTESLDGGKHRARYISELFDDLPSGFVGSLTFESDQKLGAVTLRESRNVQGEPLYATLPVVDLSLAESSGAIVFPQVAAGGGYTTQIILINPTGSTVRGKLSFVGSDGKPLAVDSGTASSSELSYDIAPHGTFRASLDRSAGLASGYAVVNPESGSSTPSGTAVFQFKRNGTLVSEAGVAASASTTRARLFVDNVDSYTGLALANRENQDSVLTFTLSDTAGTTLATTTKTLAARGHLAVFAHELFPDAVTQNFLGLLEVSSTTPVSPVTLKLTINSRDDLILTTLPVADLDHPPSASSLLFPHIAIGEGFSTRLILINTSSTAATAGKLSFYQSNGEAMSVPVAGQTSSQFSFSLQKSSGKQILPGNTAAVSKISLLDPSSTLVTKEVAVNEGNTLRPTLLVVDATGAARDDFPLSFSSLDQTVATVDAFGNVTGKKAGFSTLTIESGGVVATGTVTVVKVDSGVSGYQITGIAQDLARRLYLANTSEHTVLLAQDLKQTPAVYAGVSKTSGLKNDVRLQSWFKNPAFLAFNQANGTLYVSDGANHAIRKVQAGPDGRVETLSGTGASGSKDGPAKDALFNNPQGIALDNRGNLWVVDSGNHTVRRINLVTATVETIAGKAGASGSADGKGEAARFKSPLGIALESESLAQQLERERKGQQPPRVSLIVADTGNGVIRRVKESGEVETLGSGGQAPGASKNVSSRNAAASVPTFASPTAVAVDPLGNVYLTEPASDRVRAILRNGDVVLAGAAKTFVRPSGIVISDSGRAVVADSVSTAREITYGTPEITSISPSQISNKGGEAVTVKGRNFAPDTILVVAGVSLSGGNMIVDTQTLQFIAPVLPSGKATLTVQNRGGIAQTSLTLQPTPLKDLSPGYITTVAGGTTFSGEGETATRAPMSPVDVAMDAAGNIFIADNDNHRIRKVDAKTGIITTVAGDGNEGFDGDNGPATAAKLNVPYRVTPDGAGNIFIADTKNHRIRRVDARTGVITTVAGTGERGFSGDNGQATAARLYSPMGLTLDAAGNLLIADNDNNRIRKVDARTGIITTVAGTGESGFSGDNDLATAAKLYWPTDLALDPAGNIFIADNGNHRIRRIDSTGLITTVAGNGAAGFSGDDGPATAAKLDTPWGVAVDAAGTLYVADTYNNRIRRVDAKGVITTLVGTGDAAFSGDNGPARAANLHYPSALTLDAAGNLLIADFFNSRIRKVDAKTRVITSIAGDGEWRYWGDNGPATAAKLSQPWAVALDSAGNIFIADAANSRVRRVDARTGVITTVAGSGLWGFSGDNGPATAAQMKGAPGLSLDAAGNFFIADMYNQRIRRVDAQTGIITTVAGNGQSGFSGDNGLATSAQLSNPAAVVADAAGGIFVADRSNNRIRKVGANGIITTVAGTGDYGSSGDNGPATAAQLGGPWGVTLDAAGNILITDTYNHRIRKVDAKTGTITTVAGTGEYGFSGDRGAATAAKLYLPTALTLDAAGNMFIADHYNHRIRRVDAATGVITTIAGMGESGFSGDDGSAIAAKLRLPSGLVVDAAGNIFIADNENDRIRAIRGPAR